MDLGIFTVFWDGKPNHLPFLSLVELPGDESQSFNLKLSISKLETIIGVNSEETIKQSINLLLKQEDWRLHLVALMSLLLLEELKRESLIVLFWERLSRGSWVSPQLLVALSMSDVNFKTKADKILIEGFVINYSQLSAIDHHVSRGGVSITTSEEKVITVIDYLLNGVINDNANNDYGGSIAQNWKQRLDELIEEGRFKIAHF